MKLAYVTKKDSSDIDQWSGLTYYIKNALNDSGLETIPVGNLKEGFYYLTSGTRRIFYKHLYLKHYARKYDLLLLKHYAVQIDRTLSTLDCDVVFGQEHLAFLKTKKPIVYWTDATFAGLAEFSPDYDTNYCDATIRNGNMVEQSLLTKCRLAIFSSDWAANTALKYYDVNPAKVKVVPFGANIESPGNFAKVKKSIDHKRLDICKLLFVGEDWARKGGDKAVKTAELLNASGLKTELHVMGNHPPGHLPNFIIPHGYISKKTKQGRELIDQLYQEAHFLILPTRSECCAVSLAEASSFGLPSLTTNVGGITTAIHEGKNGLIFSKSDPPEKYRRHILKLMSNKQKYKRLALSSFREYQNRLNWKTAGDRMKKLILEFCG